MNEDMNTDKAIIGAGDARRRRIFMTGFPACIGLLPAAVSTGIASQIRQSLACAIISDMLLSFICSLLVIPIFARLALPRVAATAASRPELTTA